MELVISAPTVTGRRSRGQPKKPRPSPRHDAQAITATQPEAAWQTVEWREGSRGMLRQPVVALRVHAGRGCARQSQTPGRSWTGPEGWLLGERPLPGEEGEPRWFFRSLPVETPLSRLVERAHLRWPIEQFYEDATGEGGLDQFQGRTWEGLHRQVALLMLAYTFLMLQSVAPESSTDPVSGTAFPPSATSQSSPVPPTSPRAALPGSGVMADSNQASQSVPSSPKLTE
jgi:SRSO17 transposase